MLKKIEQKINEICSVETELISGIHFHLKVYHPFKSIKGFIQYSQSNQFILNSNLFNENDWNQLIQKAKNADAIIKGVQTGNIWEILEDFCLILSGRSSSCFIE